MFLVRPALLLPAELLLYSQLVVTCLSVLQVTVNTVVDFFQTGKGVDLEVLTSATLSKLEEIKEKTASGVFRYTRVMFS